MRIDPSRGRSSLGVGSLCLLLAAGALLLATAPGARAHAPRLGSYTCYNYLSGTPIYTGTIKLKPNRRYRVVGSPQIGRYTIPRHHRLKFVSGSYKGWRARYIYWHNGWVLKIIDEDDEEVGRCAHD